MHEKGTGSIMGGVIVLGVGVVFLLSNLGYIPEISDMWPLFPIIVGIALILGGLNSRRGTGGPPPGA
jgi:hypothetical protein